MSKAPLEVDLEVTLALHAERFFFFNDYEEKCRAVGKSFEKGVIQPFSAGDFRKYLDHLGILAEPAGNYFSRIRQLLGRMVIGDILTEIQSDPKFVLDKCYYTTREITNLQRAGSLRLAKALGARFIHREISPAIVHIAGKDENGDPRHGGSGIIFDAHHVLTCCHVVCGMQVDTVQKFQGKEVAVKDIRKHTKDDVAVILVEDTLNPVPGLGFLKPMVLQTVYTFGYPKIPCVRPRQPDTEDSYLIAQRGEVTNEHVVASLGSNLFLYSAIVRPGNSGGAIVSDEGYIVGISTELTQGKYEGEGVFSPHYAGIPADVIAKAVDDLKLGVQIPYETFE